MLDNTKGIIVVMVLYLTLGSNLLCASFTGELHYKQQLYKGDGGTRNIRVVTRCPLIRQEQPKSDGGVLVSQVDSKERTVTVAWKDELILWEKGYDEIKPPLWIGDISEMEFIVQSDEMGFNMSSTDKAIELKIIWENGMESDCLVEVFDFVRLLRPRIELKIDRIPKYIYIKMGAIVNEYWLEEAIEKPIADEWFQLPPEPLEINPFMEG